MAVIHPSISSISSCKAKTVKMAKPGKIWLAAGARWQWQFEHDDSLISRLRTIWNSESHPWEPQSDRVFILTLCRMGYDPSSAPASPPLSRERHRIKKRTNRYYVWYKTQQQAGNRKMSEDIQDVPRILWHKSTSLHWCWSRTHIRLPQWTSNHNIYVTLEQTEGPVWPAVCESIRWYHAQ